MQLETNQVYSWYNQVGISMEEQAIILLCVTLPQMHIMATVNVTSVSRDPIVHVNVKTNYKFTARFIV